MLQNTVSKRVEFSGFGLHSGAPARLTIDPAPADHGILFKRADLHDAPVLARWNHVEVAPLNTRIVNDDGISVSTIEHLMAAFAGLGIHNACCTIDGPEVPILDGSARPFVRGLSRAGVTAQSAPLRAIEILRDIEVNNKGAWARLTPFDGVKMTFEIDFADPAIGMQARSMDMANGAFIRELCDCRTFCRQSEVDWMHSQGLALGGNYDNAVVVDGDQVLSPGGFRRADEAVRHKMLDALGDLFTAGAPILGHYQGYKSGHALTNMLLRALFADPTAWRFVPIGAELGNKLPGAHISAEDLAAVA